MRDALAVEPPERRRLPLFLTFVRTSVPTVGEAALATASALLLVLAFPNFDWWWLAWIGLAPLVFVVAKVRRAFPAFLLGMLWGTIFFYGTCWWLTYPMIHYGHVPAWLAYPLFFLPVVFVSAFPGTACAAIHRGCSTFGSGVIFVAPVFWIAFDWLRYVITGQVWNALGYSQAFHPFFIQPARWGGVYAVSFLLVTANSAVALVFIRRSPRHIAISAVILILLALVLFAANRGTEHMVRPMRTQKEVVVAVQPNVPMESSDETTMQQLLQKHLDLTQQGLSTLADDNMTTRLVIWPESPMNFSYSRDLQLQNVLASLARTHHTSVLLNSLEPAPNGGGYNSAILINQEGQKTAQYDKIRLMPFGEYVPLPRWLPGSGSVRGIVGEFTPGNSYTLMPLGAFRAGVFICIEAAHPEVARSFTNSGADVLINISNDGYLGPTPVMRQHLANAIFRAVENDRHLLRITNAGISAYIDANGSVSDMTPGFQTAVRTWTISRKASGTSFYSRRGDIFVYACALITLGIVSATFMTRRRVSTGRGSHRVKSRDNQPPAN